VMTKRPWKTQSQTSYERSVYAVSSFRWRNVGRSSNSAARCRSPDHYPRLKADGGHLVPWNVRLSHVLCNQEDYVWRMRIRRMLEKGMSLEEIAENLNHKRVRRPHGSATWSATTVRKAFVS
jgi:Recombinase